MSKLLLVLVIAVAAVAVVSAQQSDAVVQSADAPEPVPMKVVHYRKGAKHTHNHASEVLPSPVLNKRPYPLVKPAKKGGARTPRGLFRKPKAAAVQAVASAKTVRPRIVRRASGSRPARTYARGSVHVHEHVVAIPHHHHKGHAEDHAVAPPLVIGNLHDRKHEGVAPLHEHLYNAHDVHIHLGPHALPRDGIYTVEKQLDDIKKTVDEHIRS